MQDLDNPERIDRLRRIIREKKALRSFYARFYRDFAKALDALPLDGLVLELGSGGGFLKEIVPFAVTSDVLPYAGVDRVVDATALPFQESSIKAVFMMNVFHHLPDVEAFLTSLTRCLRDGGLVYMMEPYPGWISAPIYSFLHHEPFNRATPDWKFESRGPVSDANSALAWIVFERDRRIFEKKFPELKVKEYRPHSPFQYWLAGGVRNWSLLPGATHRIIERLDRTLVRIWPKMGSFVTIELRKKTPACDPAADGERELETEMRPNRPARNNYR